MRWVTVVAVSYAINQMLAFTDPARLAGLAEPAPWRAPGNPHRRTDPSRHRPDFARGRADGLHRGDLGKNQCRWAKRRRVVSAARPPKPRRSPSSAIIGPVTWLQSEATEKKCRLETTV